MAIRSFLKPLSALLAALTSAGATVDASANQDKLAAAPAQTDSKNATTIRTEIAPGTEREVSFKQGEDVFSFVLARNEGGDFVAYHQSHSSHGSHSSHSSHSSHYSGR